ncbi:9167_t:CDS:2, partial [Ambispora gerdemannii]
MFNLSTGQLTALIGLINTLLLIVIGVIEAIVILRNISDEMTALEWTFNYGADGQLALTGITLWGIGPYKHNIIYLLVKVCPVVLYGASAIAPLDHDNGGLLMNQAIQPRDKVSKKSSW